MEANGDNRVHEVVFLTYEFASTGDLSSQDQIFLERSVLKMVFLVRQWKDQSLLLNKPLWVKTSKWLRIYNVLACSSHCLDTCFPSALNFV